jgi:hypothetical protein
MSDLAESGRSPRCGATSEFRHNQTFREALTAPMCYLFDLWETGKGACAVSAIGQATIGNSWVWQRPSYFYWRGNIQVSPKQTFTTERANDRDSPTIDISAHASKIWLLEPLLP